MFAENGTNFFYHAKHSGFWANVFEFEYYEYLIWFPRLLALLAVKVLDLRESYAWVTEWFGHAAVGFFYAFFCLARFREILPSDIARFLLATALGVGLLGTYELYAFINFPYHGMFLMLILLFSRLDPRPRAEIVGLTALVFLICTSKLHPVAFLPLCGLSLASGKAAGAPGALHFRWTPQRTFLAIAALALLIQAGTTLVVSTLLRRIAQELTVASAGSTLVYAVLYYLKTWLHFLLPTDVLRAESVDASWLVPCVLLLLFAALGSLCVKHWNRGNRNVVVFFLACNLIALLNMAVTTYTLLDILRENDWGKWSLPFQDRWFYLSLTALFVGAVVLVTTLFRRHALQAFFTAAMIIFVCWTKRDVLSEYDHYITEPEESFSQWELYAPLTDQPDYAIPLNPYPWMVFHQAIELGDVDSGNGSYELETSELPLVRSAVVMESSSALQESYELIAIDENGNELATGRQLTPAGYQHPYYYFESGVHAARFKFVNAAGQPFAGTLKLRFMGPADAQ